MSFRPSSSFLSIFLLGAASLTCPAMAATAIAAPEADVPKIPSLVEKNADDFSGRPWILSPYNLATGEVSQVAGAEKGKDLKVDVHFSGNGSFEHFTVTPSQPIYIPGDAKKVSMRIKRNDSRCGVKMRFVDGWGPRDGVTLEWDPRLEGTDWETVTFDIPPDWVRPVAISGLSAHNFSVKNDKLTFSYLISDLMAVTNTSDVDPVTGILKSWKPDPTPADPAKTLKEAPATPLIEVGLSTPESGNVFSDKPPRVVLQLRNWTPEDLAGKASLEVIDDAGQKSELHQVLSVSSSQTYEFPIEAKRFGRYSVRARIALQGQEPMERALSLARVPIQPELTEAERTSSPYGLNYHGGGERLFAAFKKSGLYWYRDYAFGLDLMRRAKGTDRRYNGWPFYPAILHDYEQLGLMVLPVLHAIETPVIKDGKILKMSPDRKWIDDLADILITFPQIRFWELANEYDLKPENMEGERAVNWWNYYNYHQKFGELVDLLGDGQVTAVENGRAGIYPVFTEQAISSGAFDKIGVVNCHHYTGTEPPEINFENFNQGTRMAEGRAPGSFFDNLRETKRAAGSDGHTRQAWLTEFGWDTLAGPVVSPAQQAAYLQRGFLVAFAAGIDKAFWFYNFDNAKAVQFFDGCGLLSHDKQPKLAFSAMAGLTSVLPRPDYVGSLNVGPNTWGYVFENDGKFVAGLWTVEGDAPGPKVTFASGKLLDYFGNPLPGQSAQLGIAPVYAVGLEKSDPLYLQTAYEIWSNHTMVAAAGDPVESILEVANNRLSPLTAQIHTTVPEGWSTSLPETSVTVAPGDKQKVKIPFVVSAKSKQGIGKVVFEISESNHPIKTMAARVFLQDPFALEVDPLTGVPGKASILINLQNRSALPQQGQLKLELPASWSAQTAETQIENLQPGEIRSLPMEIVWSADWKEGESARAVFTSSQGVITSAPIIPNQFRLSKAQGLKMDGDLTDWPAAAELPAWMLGSTRGDAQSRLWLAWSPEGLYGAVEVHDSKGVVNDPKFFWTADGLELFLSMKNTPSTDAFARGDHQFWFVPLFEDNRVFVGQWKVKDEIDATKYDLPGVKSAARRIKDGYVMEFFLPASAFQEFAPAPGQSIGLNANLTVHGSSHDREVYWPRKKGPDVNTMPKNWGRLKILP